MNNGFFKYGCCAFVLWIAAITTSSAQNFTTHLYTTADGLSDNYILNIYQDSYGYLWIGTAHGLNRFDGKRFTFFGIQQGLPSLLVDRVYEDHRHRLWIGTRAGMAELKGDSCYIYPIGDKQKIRFVSSIFEPDPSKLWATTDKGLYEFRDSQWVKISLCPGYEKEPVGKIIKMGSTFFINYHNTKLVQLDKDGTTKVLLSVNTSYPYFHSTYAINNQIYAGTYSGLLRREKDKWQPLFQDTLKKKYIYHCYHDKRNRWWFGTEQDGVLMIDPNGEKTNYVHIPLFVNLVSGFFEDRDGNMWVAGGLGLLKISPSPYKVVSPPGLDKTHFIRNCIAMPTGKIVVSTDDGKLLILKQRPSAGKPLEIAAIRQLKNDKDFIDFYTYDEKQRMWFTTRENDLYRLDGETLKNFSSIIPFKNDESRRLAYNGSTKQLFVCGNPVLLAGNEDRLDTFFSVDKKTIPFPTMVCMRGKDGSMLVQTFQDGVFLVTKNGYLQSLGEANNFNLSVVEGNAKEKDETVIWAADQGRGIFKYKWEKNNPPELTETIDAKNSFPNNYILDIAADEQGRLWIATRKGITLLYKTTKKNWICEHLDINVPENVSASWFSKLTYDRNGLIWTMAKDKLLVLDTKKIAISPFSINTVIEKILLHNRPTDWGRLTDSLDGYLKLPVNPILKYYQNSLTFSSNCLQYHSNTQVEYTYRLLPSDTAWSSPTPNGAISFEQLNPGNYKFEVRSHIKGFDWTTPATFSFTITKPFWETWWFRLLIILIAVFFIIFIFRRRLRRLQLKAEMQNHVKELEIKAFKLQMNPHFVHNALNSIQSLVINNKNNDAGRYINKFAQLLRQTLDGSEKTLVPLDKELSSLQLYVDLEKLRLGTDIGYAVELDETISDPSQVSVPPMIFQPFVENALWHGLSKKEGDKKISIAIHFNYPWLISEITDNGIGRNKAAQFYQTFPEGHLSKAVNIIRERLTYLNHPSNTEPISYIDLEENGNENGTTVIIRIKVQ